MRRLVPTAFEKQGSSKLGKDFFSAFFLDLELLRECHYVIINMCLNILNIFDFIEKAEILQMTVDHLKMLHAKGKY